MNDLKQFQKYFKGYGIDLKSDLALIKRIGAVLNPAVRSDTGDDEFRDTRLAAFIGYEHLHREPAPWYCYVFAPGYSLRSVFWNLTSDEAQKLVCNCFADCYNQCKDITAKDNINCFVFWDGHIASSQHMCLRRYVYHLKEFASRDIYRDFDLENSFRHGLLQWRRKSQELTQSRKSQIDEAIEIEFLNTYESGDAE